jgi:hypothetical protein
MTPQKIVFIATIFCGLLSHILLAITRFILARLNNYLYFRGIDSCGDSGEGVILFELLDFISGL